MVSDIYARVLDVVDKATQAIEELRGDDDSVRRWTEDFVQALLVTIRPEPTENAFEGYGNEYAEMGRARRVVAGSLLQLQSIQENWDIEQRVSARPNQNLRAADDVTHMINALTLCRWVLAPWRRTDDARRS